MLWKKEEQAPIGSICYWKWKSANANGPSSPYLIVHVCHLWTLVGFIFSSIDGSLVKKYVNLLEVWVIASDIIWSKVKYSRQNLSTQSKLIHTVCAIDSTSTSPTGSHSFPQKYPPRQFISSTTCQTSADCNSFSFLEADASHEWDIL